MMAIWPLSSSNSYKSSPSALTKRVDYLGDCGGPTCTLDSKPEKCKNPSRDDAEIAQPVTITGSNDYWKWLIRCYQCDVGKANVKTYNV